MPLSRGAKLAPPGQPLKVETGHPDPAGRMRRQVREIDRHNQDLLDASAEVRRKFMGKLDTKSLDAYNRTVEPYRKIFEEEIIGKFDEPQLPFNARSRKIFDEPKVTGYEVVLDVFPDVFAYGILLVPKGMKPDEKRPVVVCQHGLEGRPHDVADPKVHSPYYHQFAVKLAERGFITFAPQNPYIFGDRFRTLQRKANPLGKTLFSIIVPQHQQIVAWLKTQPNVDGRADRVLRPQLRRQDGHARAGDRDRLLPLDLLGRLQRVGLEERLHAKPVQLRAGAPNTRSSNSTSAAPSTTPRWPR